MSEAWGCINEPKVAVPILEEKENGIHYIYKRCPVRFIPKSIYQFMKIYNYHKNFPGALMPTFSKVNPRFVEASNYYDAKFADYTKEKIKNG